MANPALLEFGRDVQGYNAYAPQPSTVKYSATIAAGTAESVKVPGSYQVWVVAIRSNSMDVWVDVSGAAAIVPVGATFAATTSELLVEAVYPMFTLNAGATISVITAATTADVSIVMWPVSYSNNYQQS